MINRMSRQNLFLLGLVLALGSLVLIGCGERSGGEDGAFVLASPWEPTSLDPLVSGFVFTRLNIAETLIGVDYEGGLVPRLARSWERTPMALRGPFSCGRTYGFTTASRWMPRR